MTQQRLDRIEDEFETVKRLLASAANYAQMAHEGLAELTLKQDRTQRHLDQLSVKVDDFISYSGQRIEQLEAIAVGLDRNFLEFQRTTNAALERIDRVLDYLLRQQGGQP